jgi:hypothetical protein
VRLRTEPLLERRQHCLLCDVQPLQFARRGALSWRNIVLYTLAVVLFVLWILGVVTSFTAGGLLHILLVIAVIMIVFQLISGRRVG